MSRVRLVASLAVVLAVLMAGGWYVVQAFPLGGALEPVASQSVPAAVAFIQTPAPLPPPPPPPLPPPPPPPPSAPATDDQATSGQQTKPTVDPKVQQAKPGLPAIPPVPAPPPPPPSERGTGYTAPSPFDPVAWEHAVQELTTRMAAEPTNRVVAYTLGAYYWERAYRDTKLTRDARQAYLTKGLQAIDTALALKGDYVEALIYKSLLLRQQATLETDPARGQALVAEADKLRDQAIKIKANREAWTAVPPNAVRVGGDIKPPTKVKDVKPVYPAAASSVGVQGVVIIEAVIGPAGTVQATRVLRSIPLLDQAAIDAVNQWQFEPTLLNGVAIPVVMTVTVNFTLSSGVPDGVAGGVAGGVSGGAAGVLVFELAPPPPPPPPPVPLPPDTVRIGGEIRPPAKVVDVKPVYPEDAKQAGIQGIVIFELLIGKDGRVESAKVLRSIPALDQAAAYAVRQWVFTPTLVSGTPMNVVMTVTVNFTLQ